MEDKNEVHLWMRDDKYKSVIMKYADILERSVVSDHQIKMDKVSLNARNAYDELTSGGAILVQPGKWGRWLGLDDDKFKKAAMESEYFYFHETLFELYVLHMRWIIMISDSFDYFCTLSQKSFTISEMRSLSVARNCLGMKRLLWRVSQLLS